MNGIAWNVVNLAIALWLLRRSGGGWLPRAWPAPLAPAACPAPDEARVRYAKNARVRASMLCRGGAPGGVVGSTNDVCAVKRARPSFAES